MLSITIDPAIQADIDKFEDQLERYLAGDLDEDVFRVFRLNNGIYGQRQGGHNQMVRVKVPYGSITPEQLDMFAHIAETYSRGWGHITTRQNIQFHFVAPRAGPRGHARPRLGRADLPGGLRRHRAQRAWAATSPAPARTRSSTSARGPRPPSSTSCATRSPSACPASSRSTSPAARPTAARPCSTTSASSPPPARRDDGTIEPGFRVFVAGGLGRQPASRPRPRGVHRPRGPLATLEACLRVFEQPRQPRQQAPGPDEVARRHARAGRSCRPGS